MPSAIRPEKRILVRWTDDLDKTLLLAIQYACQENGLRIPFDKVAEIMGVKFSSGAIIQHLSKLRTKMVDAGIQVPPPLRRGMTTKEPSKVYATVTKKRKAGDISKAITGAAAAATPTTSTRRAAKAKGRKNKKELTDDEESGEELDLYDSDDEYGGPKKKAKKPKKTPVKKEKLSDAEVSPDTVKAESEEEDVKDEADDSPGVHTRGVRPNYANLEAGGSDDEEDYEVEYEEDDKDVGDVALADDEYLGGSEAAGLPTPDYENDEKALVPQTPTPALGVAAPTPIRTPDFPFSTPIKAARDGMIGGGYGTPLIRTYSGDDDGFNLAGLFSTYGSQQQQQEQMIEAPVPRAYSNSMSGDVGGYDVISPYPRAGTGAAGRNMDPGLNTYMPYQSTSMRRGGYEVDVGMGRMVSGLDTLVKQITNTNANATGYITPPATRNNSTATSSSTSSSMETPSYSQLQSQPAALTAAQTTTSSGLPFPDWSSGAATAAATASTDDINNANWMTPMDLMDNSTGLDLDLPVDQKELFGTFDFGDYLHDQV